MINLTRPVQRKISVLQSPEDWSLYMTAWFTKLLALNHDLDTARQGIIMIIAADGAGWENFSG